MSVRILRGNCAETLRELDSESVHAIVTSPPYWGLRDYGIPPVEWPAISYSPMPGLPACVEVPAMSAVLGLEPTLEAFIGHIVLVFREARRVLRDDGTAWVNMGDSYAGSRAGGSGWPGSTINGAQPNHSRDAKAAITASRRRDNEPIPRSDVAIPGLKPKDLIGIPWRVAFALQADGWYLRQDIIWSKLNPMPESVTDRCTKAHEYVFLLSKSQSYYCDMGAIAEPLGAASLSRLAQDVEAQAGSDRVPGKTNGAMKAVGGRRAAGNKTHKGTTAYEDGDERLRTKAGLVGFAERERAKVDAGDLIGTRNKRSVWTIATQPFSEAHFATMAPQLAETCIRAGCPAGGVVLDPFGGAGTTGLVADRLQRDALLIELNPAYADIAERRIVADAPLFAEVL